MKRTEPEAPSIHIPLLPEPAETGTPHATTARTHDPTVELGHEPVSPADSEDWAAAAPVAEGRPRTAAGVLSMPSTTEEGSGEGPREANRPRPRWLGRGDEAAPELPAERDRAVSFEP